MIAIYQDRAYDIAKLQGRAREIRDRREPSAERRVGEQGMCRRAGVRSRPGTISLRKLQRHKPVAWGRQREEWGGAKTAPTRREAARVRTKRHLLLRRGSHALPGLLILPLSCRRSLLSSVPLQTTARVSLHYQRLLPLRVRAETLRSRRAITRIFVPDTPPHISPSARTASPCPPCCPAQAQGQSRSCVAVSGSTQPVSRPSFRHMSPA